MVASLPCNGCHTNLRLPVVVGLQRGSRAVDGWDWEASCTYRCRQAGWQAGRQGREGGEQGRKSNPRKMAQIRPIWSTMAKVQTASWTPSHAVFQVLYSREWSGSLETAGVEAVATVWTGWTGHMDRQLTLNRLDVMHRRLLDSYPQGPGPGPACTICQSRSYDCLGTPIPTSQLNSKTPARQRPVL